VRTTINSNVTIPQQEISLPMTLVIGNDSNNDNTTTRVNDGNRRSWIFGLVWTLVGLGILAILVALIWGAWRSMPEPATMVDYSSNFTKINEKLDKINTAATDAATAATAAQNASETNGRILIPVARRVNASGKVLDRAFSVRYDVDGNVVGATSLDDVLAAANRAVTAAEARPRVIVRRVEAKVDMTETNSRLSAIERALADQTKPVLERVE